MTNKITICYLTLKADDVEQYIDLSDSLFYSLLNPSPIRLSAIYEIQTCREEAFAVGVRFCFYIYSLGIIFKRNQYIKDIKSNN